MQAEIEQIEAKRHGRHEQQGNEPADDDGADGLFNIKVPDDDYTSSGRFGTRCV